MSGVRFEYLAIAIAILLHKSCNTLIFKTMTCPSCTDILNINYLFKKH